MQASFHRTIRTVVIGAAVTAVFVGVGAGVRDPASGASAASPAHQAPASPIKHVVVLFQENHSFDETLGAYCQTRATPCDGYTGQVTLQGGTVVPMKPSPDVVPTVNHSVTSQAADIDGGAMDGWATEGGCRKPTYGCLTYYSPSQIPNLAALSDRFAVSDRTFSMASSPSWGGHLYVAAGTLDGFTGMDPKPAPGVTPGLGWGCDSNKVTQYVDPAGTLMTVPSCVPNADGSGAFETTPVPHVPTIFDSLDNAGQSWKIYGAPKTPTKVGAGYTWSICPSFADCVGTPQVNNLVWSANVLTDAADGTLPAYSIVTPSKSSAQTNGAESSQHNGSSMLAGDNWIARIVSTIENGPDWNSTAIFITYDDCGCFYDHVAPPRNPDGTRAGIRLPLVIVSPYAKSGFTDSRHATAASILAFTEHTFGLPPLSINDANAYAYSNAFDYSQTPLAGIRLTQHPLSPATLSYLQAHPPDESDST